MTVKHFLRGSPPRWFGSEVLLKFYEGWFGCFDVCNNSHRCHSFDMFWYVFLKGKCWTNDSVDFPVALEWCRHVKLHVLHVSQCETVGWRSWKNLCISRIEVSGPETGADLRFVYRVVSVTMVALESPWPRWGGGVVRPRPESDRMSQETSS